MTGLPRVTSTTRRRPVWDAMILGGIERLTESLMRGDEFSEDDLSAMRDLRRRLAGFDTALAARERAAGMTDDLIENT
jgi:hypothetical protein